MSVLIICRVLYICLSLGKTIEVLFQPYHNKSDYLTSYSFVNALGFIKGMLFKHAT